MDFAEQLRTEHHRLGLTQAQVADLLEVSFEIVSKWERELSAPAKITQEGALARLRKPKGKSR